VKEDLRTHLGLILVGLGVVYLIWFVPGLPGWGWALLGAAIFFLLSRLRNVAAATGYGALFLGWALGALAADVSGLQSLKLVGSGLGLALWGWLENVAPVSWLGLALLVAGALVFTWEASLGGWLALALLAIGLYLAWRGPGEGPATAGPRPQNDDYLAAVLRWRNQEARRRGVLNTSVISDEELGCLSNLSPDAGPAELAGCLGGDEERARQLWSYLRA